MDAEPVTDAADAEPEPPNPVHEVLTMCGITTAANRATLINIEGLDSVEALASMKKKFKNLERIIQVNLYGNVCKISLGTQPRRLLNDGGSEGLGI
jgi:hypothetical protein